MITLTIQNLNYISNVVRNGIKQIEKIENKVPIKFQKEVKKELEYICESSIDRFYESYEPHMYDRWGDLYKIPKVNVTQNVWEVTFSDTLEHEHGNATDEYIIKTVFEQGWHGGAWRDYIMSPAPWYRRPFNGTWVGWLRQAEQDMPPRMEIIKRSSKYLDKMALRYIHEYDEPIEEIVENVTRIINDAINI